MSKIHDLIAAEAAAAKDEGIWLTSSHRTVQSHNDRLPCEGMVAAGR